MDNLVIDNELATTVIDDEDANTAAAVGKGALDLGEEAALIDDGEARSCRRPCHWGGCRARGTACRRGLTYSGPRRWAADCS